MRLNLDCVRDILLCVEENTGLRQFCVFHDIGQPDIDSFLGTERNINYYQDELMKKYENDELIYHIRYCEEAGLLSCSDGENNSIFVRDLTPKGHDFLGNIRDGKIWDGTKAIAGTIGAKTLDVVTQIASNIVTQLIKSHFGLI